MKAARAYAWGDVRVEETPAPLPGPGEIVVRVDVCGLCGSDALPWYVNRKAPVVLGHEPVGTVVQVGAGVTQFTRGDRVFVHHHAPCMTCEECRRRLWSNCETWKQTRLEPGGFAEYALVPAPNVAQDVFRVPPGMDDETATFIEPVACCIRAVNRARIGADDVVLVIGLGAMGLLLGQLSALAGARAVWGTDLRQDRNRFAEGFGIRTLPAADGADAVRSALGGRGADIVIITPGTAGAVNAGIAAAAPGARVVCFTPLDPGEPFAPDPALLYFREIELLQSYSCGPDETRRSLALLERGVLRTAELVTGRVDLGGVARALHDAHDGASFKVLVYPHGVPQPPAS